MNPDRTAVIVLAAGSASRFGAPKMLASLRGRPVLQHVLDVAAGIGFAEVIVVLGDAADEIEGRLTWRSERRLRNADPGAGISGSLRVGLANAGPDGDAVLVLLGDQPFVRPDVIRSLLEAATSQGPPVVVPRYSEGGGANPLLVRRDAWHLADEATGDRGLGPVIRSHSELVAEVAVEGSNPDIDTPGDLAALE